MIKNILVSGILGGIVMIAVMTGLRLSIPALGGPELRSIPDQVPVHAALKARITEPGTYVFPYATHEDRSALFPDYLNEPIFAVTYKGFTHATVPGFASAGILSFLLAPMAAAWLLSQASEKVLATYSRRAAFVASLGFFIAVSTDLLRALSDEQTLVAVAGAAVLSILTWSSVGLVLAWRVKPRITGA